MIIILVKLLIAHYLFEKKNCARTTCYQILFKFFEPNFRTKNFASQLF